MIASKFKNRLLFKWASPQWHVLRTYAEEADNALLRFLRVAPIHAPEIERTFIRLHNMILTSRIPSQVNEGPQTFIDAYQTLWHDYNPSVSSLQELSNAIDAFLQACNPLTFFEKCHALMTGSNRGLYHVLVELKQEMATETAEIYRQLLQRND